MTIAMMLACVCLVRAPAPAAEDAAKRAYLEGWYAETAEQDPAKALAAYGKVLEAKGEGRVAAMARLRIGFCLRSLGKEDDARTAFQEVVEEHAAEGDLAARARRLLAGETEESVASLPIADPRAEVLSILDAMMVGPADRAGPEDVRQFLAILRLATPEYVRDVVLVKNPAFGARAAMGISRCSAHLPDADPSRLLGFSAVLDLRPAVFGYIGLRGDRSIVPDLSALLDSGDADLRGWAAHALGALNVREAAPRILALFGEETDDERATRLATALAALRFEQAVGAIAARGAAESTWASNAAKALSRIGTPEAIEALRPFLQLSWSNLEPPEEGDAAARILRMGLASDDVRVLSSALANTTLWLERPGVLEAIVPTFAEQLAQFAEMPDSQEILEAIGETLRGRRLSSSATRSPVACARTIAFQIREMAAKDDSFAAPPGGSSRR
ncbi:MAG: hypothetical protein JXP34_16250 [Planctomycetes bacterium]|nr:hypothetical protein [Planctomycetota bacterium]